MKAEDVAHVEVGKLFSDTGVSAGDEVVHVC